MARINFIFSFILVFFLTIVSNKAFANNLTDKTDAAKITSFAEKETPVFIFCEDFESGILTDWKQSGEWEVSSAEKISGSFSLKHSTKATSGASSLFHAARANWNEWNVEWSFKLKNGNWDPSSTNRFWFYLSADTIRTDQINGWAVGVNISGSSDLLELWRIRSGKADSLVVRSDLDWNASTVALVHVQRTARGNWTLDYQNFGETTSKIFTGTDCTHFDFRNIGFCFNYTSTRAGQLWLDDLVVSQSPADLYIQKLTIKNQNTIELTFNKVINPTSVSSARFVLTDENNRNVPITQTQATPNSNRSIDLSFGKTEGTELRLSVSGITDISGKTMNPDIRSFSYSFLPETGSVLINEVLFNTFTGGVDFVELVNVSEQTIPVHRLKLATRNDTLALKQVYTISPEKRYLKPGQYLCCTKDPKIVSSQYITNNPESFCAMKSFPSYSDDTGIVVLLNDSLEIIDEFDYSTKMHSPFLADENGVSLERISLQKTTNDCTNWTSAASSVGFATPGLPNSQTESETQLTDEIIPEPKVFSPNGDGYNDELKIKFSLSKPGYIANVLIFDAIGRQIKHLVKNQSLAQDGSWLWNGENDDGQRMNIGVYVILVEIFNQEGQVKKIKKTCTLTGRME